MVSKAYMNKFYKSLMYVAKEIFGTYSLCFENKAEMAYYMDMPFTDTFSFAVDEFDKTQYGTLKKIGKKIEVEVLPF